ncbi:MAG: glutamate racemase [Candidatus Rifleibacteriota bacterium]
MNDKRSIGIFDSGVGGLTVYKKVRELLPHENLIYFGDTARVPYGGKSINVIKNYSSEIARFLEKLKIKMLVVACNTASAMALSHLKKQLSIPVIGVIEPGVRAAVRAADGNLVGVIGTRGTINSQAYQKRIKRLRSDIEVISSPCPLLVPIVEENIVETEIARLAIDMYLKDFKSCKVSALILACTHYPLLKNRIAEFLGPEVVLIDSAHETAHEVKDVLKARRINCADGQTGLNRFFVSDSPETFVKIGETFLGRPLQSNCELHQWKNE